MASLSNRNAIKYRHLGQNEKSLLKPQAETLRDRILKHYLQKQLRTNESLLEHRQNQRNFCRAAVEESITNSTRGLTSFKEFKKLEKSLAVKQVLKSSGLSEAEIHFLLNENEELYLESPVGREEKLKAIKDKLEGQQQRIDSSLSKTEQFSGAVCLNRHDFEEEINSLPVTEKADKLTACLIRLQPHKDDNIPGDHPINHIKEIADALFSTEIHQEKLNKSRKRKSDPISNDEHSKTYCMEPQRIYITEKPKSLWDMKEIPVIIKKNEPKQTLDNNKSGKKEVNKLYLTKKEKVIKPNPSKPYVLTLNDEELIPLREIECNRKTLKEIKQIDKFRNLHEGKPSNTIYIKNLSHKASSHDLASLFGHFECKLGSKISYRILNGRMKGQAFVTFHSKDAAISAMEKCNGFVLHEKPLVMEYSRK